MNPDDKTAKKKFQKIQAAFDVLNDPQKREMYDRYGSSFEAMGAGGPRAGAWKAGPGTGSGPGNPFGGFQFEDVDFGQFFGERYGAEPGTGSAGGFSDLFKQFRRSSGARRGGAGRSRRGADLVHEVSIPFTTAILGGEIQLTIGRRAGHTETISVKIPAGIEDGKRIRLRGQGESFGEEGTAGDLILNVRVEPHPYYQRRGNHLVVRVPVTLAEAALGAKVDIPTSKGTVTIQIPPGTSSGTKLRVKGYGVAPKSGPAGDLLAEVQIMLPKNLDDTAREWIRQIDARAVQNPRQNLRW